MHILEIGVKNALFFTPMHRKKTIGVRKAPYLTPINIEGYDGTYAYSYGQYVQYPPISLWVKGDRKATNDIM